VKCVFNLILFVAASHLIDRNGENTSSHFRHYNHGNQGGGDEDKDKGMLLESVGDQGGGGEDEEMLAKTRSVQVGRRVAMLDATDDTTIHHGCIIKISRDGAGQMIYAVKFDGEEFLDDEEEFSIQEIEGKWDHLELPKKQIVWWNSFFLTVFTAAINLFDKGMLVESEDEETPAVEIVVDSRSVEIGRRVAMGDEIDRNIIHYGSIVNMSTDGAGQMIYGVKFDEGGVYGETEEFSIKEIKGKRDHLELPK
jgi:hypothetical protein